MAIASHTSRSHPGESRPATGEADTSFPTTKLTPPPPRPQHIVRDPLLRRLAPSALPQLTLISAPPGYGKTTLLAEFSASADGVAVAWLSLDLADADAGRFWAGATAALATARPASFERWADLARRGASPAATLIPRLIQEASALDVPVVLVLDDYHRIEASAVHDQIADLFERLPPQLRVVISTRSDPPFPLGRLRASGELAEIRAADLRFSNEEAASFLNDNLDLGLSPGDLEALLERTEGWATALYLAALSLAPNEDRHALVQSFAGTNRFIFEYLSEEVLATLSQDEEDFLLRLSILDTLTGSLVDAVLERSGSRQALHALEKSNLLLVPLDNDGQWYRFHHLFADLLRAELAERQPELIPKLHARASAWFAEHGLIDEAITHALAAADASAAADLIAASYWPYLQRGRVATVHRWISALPEEDVFPDPRLCIAAAWACGYQGRPSDVEAWLDRAAKAGKNSGLIPDGHDSVDAASEIVRAGFALGDVGAQVRAGRRAVQHAYEDKMWEVVADACLGISLYWAGEPGEAAIHIRRASAHVDADDIPQAAAVALAYLALIELERGRDDAEAEALVAQGLAIVQANHLEDENDTGLMHLAQGKLLARRGSLDKAETELERAALLLERGSNVLETALALLELASVQEQLGRREDAQAILADVTAKLEGFRDTGILAKRLPVMRERLGMVAVPELEGDTSAGLTARELEVLAYLPGKLSKREIGAALWVSFNTVATHMRSIYRKLGVSSRSEAVDRARELNIL